MPQPPANTTRDSPVRRVPPCSAEAEKGVLGSILLDASRVMDFCIEMQLTPESFYDPVHCTIYTAMEDMARSGALIDILTVSERLGEEDKLDQVGGMECLERLVDSTPTTAHAEYYIDLVRQKHLLRAVITCARDAERACFEEHQSADLILSSVEQAFLNITERQHGFLMPWQQAIQSSMERVDRILTHGPGAGGGLPTGLSNLDKILQGLKPSEMIVLAARPSMGKTSLAMNICENIALGGKNRESRPVAIFSLEMAQEALALRMLCAKSKVPSFQINSGHISSAQVNKKLTRAASVLMKAPIYVDDTGGLDVMELRARARRLKKKHDVQLIMIDYLQLMSSREYAVQGRQLETASISSNVKAMAKELKIPVMVLSQLSRAPEQRDKTGRPKLSDLRDSGSIEQDADVVLLLRRPCKYPGDTDSDDARLAIVDVAKHRNGPTGEIHLNFDEDFTSFSDRADGMGIDFDDMESEE